MMRPTLTASVTTIKEVLDPRDTAIIHRFRMHLLNGPRKRSHDTARTYESQSLRFLALAGLQVGERAEPYIRKSKLLEVIEGINNHEATRRNMYYAVKSFAAFLHDIEQLDDVEARKIRKMRWKFEDSAPQSALSRTQVVELVRYMLSSEDYNYYDRVLYIAIVSILAYTGLRIGELCRLGVGDVDLENESIFVRRGKGGKARYVGIPRVVRPLLRLYAGQRHAAPDGTFFVRECGKPLNRDQLGRRIQRLSLKTGQHITAHMFRRTFATENADNGVPLNKLQIAMGHSDIRTTMRYVRTREDKVCEEMREWSY